MTIPAGPGPAGGLELDIFHDLHRTHPDLENTIRVELAHRAAHCGWFPGPDTLNEMTTRVIADRCRQLAIAALAEIEIMTAPIEDPRPPEGTV
jgi:hypothetical protein